MFGVPAAAPSEFAGHHMVPVACKRVYVCVCAMANLMSVQRCAMGSTGRQGLCEHASPRAPTSHGIQTPCIFESAGPTGGSLHANHQ